MYLIGAGIITAILSRSMKITAKLQTVLSSIKILSCVFIIVAGVVNIIRTSRSLQPWIECYYSKLPEHSRGLISML